MSNDHIQRRMDFIVEQQAKFSVDIEELKEAQKQLTSTVTRMASEMDKTREVLNSVISEMREGFSNLIIANESTRELAAQAARLAIQANERVGRLEEKLDRAG